MLLWVVKTVINLISHNLAAQHPPTNVPTTHISSGAPSRASSGFGHSARTCRCATVAFGPSCTDTMASTDPESPLFAQWVGNEKKSEQLKIMKYRLKASINATKKRLFSPPPGRQKRDQRTILYCQWVFRKKQRRMIGGLKSGVCTQNIVRWSGGSEVKEENEWWKLINCFIFLCFRFHSSLPVSGRQAGYKILFYRPINEFLQGELLRKVCLKAGGKWGGQKRDNKVYRIVVVTSVSASQLHNDNVLNPLFRFNELLL